MNLSGILKSFILVTLLTGNFDSLAQLYSEAGISVPDSNLKNLAGTGLTLGLNCEYRLSDKFKARVSSAFVYFSTKHYGALGIPKGRPLTLDYKTSMLPVQLGIKFFPFSKFLGGKLFISGRLGIQAIFFESNSIGYLESVLYQSKELDFSYVPSIGFDFKNVCFEYEQQFIASRGDEFLKSVTYTSFKLSVKIFRIGSQTP